LEYTKPMIDKSKRRGASVVEYALILALLAFVFIAANKVLKSSASTRYDRATNPVRNMAPCGDFGTTTGLGGPECL
jgi:Flp pilus assembly pilin Flp